MAGETIRDIKINIGLALKETKLPEVDVSKLTSDLGSISKSVDTIGDSIGTSVSDIDSAMDTAGQGLERSSMSAASSLESMQASASDAGESIKQVAGEVDTANTALQAIPTDVPIRFGIVDNVDFSRITSDLDNVNQSIDKVKESAQGIQTVLAENANKGQQAFGQMSGSVVNLDQQVLELADDLEALPDHIDLSAVLAELQDVNQAIDNVKSSTGSMGEVLDNASSVADEAMSTMTSSVNVLDNAVIELTSTMDAAPDVTSQWSTTVDTLTDNLDDATDEAERFAQSQERVRQGQDKAQAAARQHSESLIKVGQNLKGAGDGAFAFARGVALVGVKGEEDLKKVLETVAQIQGSFDLFRGSIDIIDNVSQAIGNYRVASEATAAKNTALSVSNTAVGTTSRFAAGGLATMTAAAGPIVVGLVAVSAVLIPLISHFRNAGSASKSAAGNLNNMSTSSENVRKRLEETAGVVGVLNDRISDLDALSPFRDASDQLMTTKNTIMLIDDAIADMDDTAIKYKATLDSLGATNVERANALQALESTEEQLEKLGRLRSQQARQQLSLEQQVAQEKEDQFQTDLDQLQVLNDKIEAEEDRNRSLQQQLGRLSDVEFARLKQLDVAAGKRELTREELEELGQLGGQAGREFADKQFEEFGKRRGGLTNIGGGPSRLPSLVDQRTQIQDQLGVDPNKLLDDLQKESIERLADRERETKEEILSALEDVLAEKEALAARIKEIRESNRRRRTEVGVLP